MASIEKRVIIRVIVKDLKNINAKRIIILGIGVKIPVPWMEKGQKKPKIRRLPIVKIDMEDKDKPKFVLDASTKYNSRFVQHSFNEILEYCFDYIDIPNDIDCIKYDPESNIEINEYVAIINEDGYECLLDDIVKVEDYNMVSCTGRICEIDIDSGTFTIDNSEEGRSSIRVYSIDKIFSIRTSYE